MVVPIYEIMRFVLATSTMYGVDASDVEQRGS